MSTLAVLARRLLLACAAFALAALLLPGAARAATCGAAAVQGTAPNDFRDYCWLDFSSYNNATASSSAGQPFTFNLPDGTTVSMTVRTTGTGGFTSAAVPSWTGSAFGNSAFNNIPGRPILYTATNGTSPVVTLSNINVTPPAGAGSSTYSIVVADGESTNSGETLTFTTDRGAWQQIAQIRNGTSNVYPTLAYSNGGQTVRETGANGTVGSYVFRSDNNPTTVSAALVGSGLQGIIIGMRYASISVVSQIINKRYNPADQFTFGLSTTTGTSLISGSTSGAGINGFTPAIMPTVAASYPFVVSQAMVAGSVGTLASYTTTLSCTNANPSATVMPSNVSGSSYTFANLRYGDSVLCTFTNTPIFNTLGGTVYRDANHNGSQDGTEAGPGATGFFVKIAPSSGGTCVAPATQAATVTAATGAYTLPELQQGTYCLILDDNNTLTDVTPTLPAGWLGTQNPGGSIPLTLSAGRTLPPQVFGVYNGSRLTGTVFADTGIGSGVPNNGLKDGTEAGLANLTVTARSGATVVETAVTSGDGGFTLWIPATVTGTVSVSPTPPSGALPTSGSAGTTSGSYVRPNLSFAPTAGQSYSGVGFGLAQPSTFGPDGAQTAQPGTVVFYAHTFQAGSGGQVGFALSGASNPASPAWNTVLYADANCSGNLDAAEPLVATAISVTSGQRVCIVVKQFVPAGIAYGAQNTATVTATFTYTNANPALSETLLVTDVTTVGQASALSLRKLVSNVTRGSAEATTVNATPGEVLQYSLTAQNNGGSAVSTLMINDATPAFTTYVSAACPTPLPAGISACAISTQPAAGGTGALRWTFTGSLAAGGALVVTYRVQLTQ
ncbi:MAG: hypothetical protein K0R58_2864 [Ramlibacter sp.]|jgi:uncharacterized repeat protein (TIGR01451 family)|nr:hypothetical protein [Ramlibacter sp.]